MHKYGGHGDALSLSRTGGASASHLRGEMDCVLCHICINSAVVSMFEWSENVTLARTYIARAVAVHVCWPFLRDAPCTVYNNKCKIGDTSLSMESMSSLL